MLDINPWPSDYFSSRQDFIASAQSCGAQLTSKSIKALGPKAEPLTLDLAACVSATDKHRIVITSGVHGAEGFIGAATQLQVLRLIADEGLPKDTGVVLIHAVNPWGYAHLRRVNEDNVDVNRNFIDFDQYSMVHPASYAELNPIINPEIPPSFSGDVRYWLSAGKLIVKHRGIEPLAGPIATGQYQYPKGLFFGGQHACESRTHLEQWVQEYTADIPLVTVLDVHSGLGEFGQATLISNTNCAAINESVEWLQKHYEMPIVLDNAPDNAYNASGSFSQWCQTCLAEQHFTFLCVEIGTVNPLKVFSALRRENQAYHWAKPNSIVYEKTKQSLLKVFSPDSEHWREKAVEQGVSVFKKSLKPNIPNVQ